MYACFQTPHSRFDSLFLMGRQAKQTKTCMKCSGTPHKLLLKAYCTKRQWQLALCDVHWAEHLAGNSSARKARMVGNSLRSTGSMPRELERDSSFCAVDNFCGTASMAKKLTKLNLRTTSVDVRPTCRTSPNQIFLCKDMLKGEDRLSIVQIRPNFFWNSIPCEDFSRANTAGGESCNGMQLLRYTVHMCDSIEALQPTFLPMIESPMGCLRVHLKDILAEWSPIAVDYCRYNDFFSYRKRTDIYVKTKHKHFFNFKLCRGYNCKHAIFNKYTGRYYHPTTVQSGPTHIRIGPRRWQIIPGTARYDDRIRMPGPLCYSIAWQAKVALRSMVACQRN